MSSLRLALKQSLEESGHLADSGSKKRNLHNHHYQDDYSNMDSEDDEPPVPPQEPLRPKKKIGKKKRGRPPKKRAPTPLSSSSCSPQHQQEHQNEQHHHQHHQQHHNRSHQQHVSDEEHSAYSSSENEFSETDSYVKIPANHRQDERPPSTSNTILHAGTTTRAHEDVNNQDLTTRVNTNSHSIVSSDASHNDDVEVEPDVEPQVEEETVRPHKLSKKQLKAANKIQNHWKKSKCRQNGSNLIAPNSPKRVSAVNSTTNYSHIDATQAHVDTNDFRTHHVVGSATSIGEVEEDASQSANTITENNSKDSLNSSVIGIDSKANNASSQTQGLAPAVKKNKNGKQKGNGKSKTVPPPDALVLDWSRSLPIKRARKNIATGLRVKVRFATKVKKEGKILKKKKWYGGRVSAVSKEGSKIRIKYDDGTTEISKFPDKDVVVDDEFNGEHQANANKFIPPRPEPEPDDEEEQQFEDEEFDHDCQSQDSENTDVKKSSNSTSKIISPAREEIGPSTNQPLSSTLSVKSKKQHKADMTEFSHTTYTKPISSEKLEEHSSIPSKTAINKKREVLSTKRKSLDESGDKTSYRSSDQVPNKAEDSTVVRQDGGLPRKAMNELSNQQESMSADKREQRKKISESKRTQDRSKSPFKPTLTIRIPNVKKDDKVGLDQWSPSSGSNRDSAGLLEDKFNRQQSSSAVTSNMESRDTTERHEKSNKISNMSRRRRNLSGSVGDHESERLSKRNHIRRNSADLEDSSRKILSPKSRQNRQIIGQGTEVADNGQHGSRPIQQNRSSPLDGHFANVRNGTFDKAAESDSASVKTTPSVKGKRKRHEKDESLASGLPRRPLTDQVEPAALPGKGDVRHLSAPSPELPETLSKDKVKAGLISSKYSAFERKGMSVNPLPSSKISPAGDVLGHSSTSLDTIAEEGSTNATPAVRSGRRAAQQANERIASKQENVIQDFVGKKRKRREKEKLADGKQRRDSDGDRFDRGVDDSESSADDDNNWVQCDKCGKWRILPNHVKVSSLPKHWYCENNIYDSKRNSCSAPEQSLTQIVKEKRRGKKRMRHRELLVSLDQSATEAGLTRRETARSSDLTGKEKDRSIERSRSPFKDNVNNNLIENVSVDVTSSEQSVKSRRLSRLSPNSVASAENTVGSGSGNDIIRGEKKVSLSSSGKKKSQQEFSEPNLVELASGSEGKVKNRGRSGRKNKDSNKESEKNSSGSTSSQLQQHHPQQQQQQKEKDKDKDKDKGKENDKDKDQTEADNLEWVQCEKCEKWRKLPSHISANELPDVWYCSMNTWSPASASCDSPEDKADGLQDIGIFGTAPSQRDSSGKLSYRNLIFGSGRKVNRPISERTRAAESLFATPINQSDGGSTYPTVMYASSSAFIPRSSRSSNSCLLEENKSGSVFDLMSHSNLWGQLWSGVNEQLLLQFANPQKLQHPRVCYDSMPVPMKQLVRNLVCYLIATTALTSDEIFQAIKNTREISSHAVFSEVRAQCSVDVVVAALCELVQEGLVEIVQMNVSEWSVKDWNPYYRLAVSPVTELSVPSENPPPRITRCMKIAKPWKKTRSMNQNDWIR